MRVLLDECGKPREVGPVARPGGISETGSLIRSPVNGAVRGAGRLAWTRILGMKADLVGSRFKRKVYPAPGFYLMTIRGSLTSRSIVSLFLYSKELFVRFHPSIDGYKQFLSVSAALACV